MASVCVTTRNTQCIPQLTEYFLNRVLDEGVPELLEAAEKFRKRNGHSYGRRLTTFLRCNSVAEIAAARVRPAIAGLRKMGRHDLVAELEREYGAWEDRIRAVGEACPKVFPKHMKARSDWIEKSAREIETRGCELIAMIGK